MKGIIRNMWSLYNRLLELIPDHVRVESCLIGAVWTGVRSAAGSGLAMTAGLDLPYQSVVGKARGAPLREFGERVKSWELFTATIGMAAVNSYINTAGYQEAVQQHVMSIAPHNSIFDYFEDKINGKKVAFIGHLPGAENYREICEVKILERNPQHGDLLDPAGEYILPGQDVVFISGTTIANKTLPRLLQLCRNAFVILWGPSSPLTPILFDYGVDVVSSFVIRDSDEAWRVVAEGGRSMDLRPFVQAVSMRRPGASIQM
jgi:uncharacterized protein (DUF4213/DUF364 family)